MNNRKGLLLIMTYGLLGCSTYSFKTTVRPYKLFEVSPLSPTQVEAGYVFEDTRQGTDVTYSIDVAPYEWGREYSYRIHSSIQKCSPESTDCSGETRVYKAEDFISSKPMERPTTYYQPLRPLCSIMATFGKPSVQKMKDLFKKSGTKLIVENNLVLQKKIDQECSLKRNSDAKLQLKILPTGHVILKEN